MKYSIIIPVRNCREFVEHAIQSVLAYAGDREDYEVLVSDNYSSDGSYEYIQTIEHPRVRIMRPPQVCTMSSHYEWLLTQIRGDWVTIVGSDDGVQGYFFPLADRLIEEAQKREIRIVNGARAYYFWKGCSKEYRDMQTSFHAEARFEIKNAAKEFMPTLLTGQGFFSMPQIYAGSLVHRSVIDTIKAHQGGVFYKSASPDGYASAAIASIGERYIHSSIPLTWIGSSPKSIGGGVNKQKQQELFALPKDTIACAKELGGDYASLANLAVTMWMWEPMLNASALQDEKTQAFYRSKFAAYCIIATMKKERDTYPSSDKHESQERFDRLMRHVGVSPALVSILAVFLRLYRQDFFARVGRKIARMLGISLKRYSIETYYNTQAENATILESSALTKEIYDTHLAQIPIEIRTKHYWH